MLEDVADRAEGSGNDVRPIEDTIGMILRLNGPLLAEGGRLIAPLGLTIAWLQVLATLVAFDGGITAAHLARCMGLARQSVQRTVDLLAAEGFVTLRANPHHKRAPLVAMTLKGREAVKAARELQRPWLAELAGGMAAHAVLTTQGVLRRLEARFAEAAHLQTRTGS